MFAFGTILGCIYVLKNREPGSSILKYGVFTGVIGGFLSSFCLALYEWIRFSVIQYQVYGYDLNITVLFIFIGYLAVSGIMIGLIVGALISAYFMYREAKKEGVAEKEKTYESDDFFDDLIEK
ncbi:MAG: hypothetical protein ACFFEN_11295 [Candidatus Thorarchaeota archaeon]